MSSPRLPEFDTSYAVLLGVSRYATADLEDLPAVHGNVRGLQAVLTDPALCGFAAERVIVVLDPSTAGEVMDPVGQTAARATDLLLVYFAGHGLLTGDTAELHLATGSSVPGKPWTSLPFRYLASVLRRARAAAKVLLLDCCYSGRAARELMAEPTRLAVNQVPVDGVYVMTSTSGTQVAIAPAGRAHTAFTGGLLDVVRAGVPGAGPLLSMSGIFEVVRSRLGRAGLPLPEQFHRNNAGALALVRNSAAPQRRHGPGSGSGSGGTPAPSARQLLAMTPDRAAATLEHLAPAEAARLVETMPARQVAPILQHTGAVFATARLAGLPAERAAEVLGHIEPAAATRVLMKAGCHTRIALLDALIGADRAHAGTVVRQMSATGLVNAVFADATAPSTARVRRFLASVREDAPDILDAESAPADEPWIARRRLGRQLRALREASGATQHAVAEEVRWTPARLRRIERGAARATSEDLRTLLEHYDVRDPAVRARLGSLSDVAAARPRPLPTNLPAEFIKYLALERATTHLQLFNPVLLPGLLQTREVAAEIIATYFDDRTNPEIERRVRLRLQRQQDLLGKINQIDIDIVIHENAVRVVVGSAEAMRDQVSRLISVAQHPSVRLRLLPAEATPKAALSSFVVLDFGAREDGAVYTEGALSQEVIDDSQAVDVFRAAFYRERDGALNEEDTLRLLRGLR